MTEEDVRRIVREELSHFESLKRQYPNWPSVSYMLAGYDYNKSALLRQETKKP